MLSQIVRNVVEAQRSNVQPIQKLRRHCGRAPCFCSGVVLTGCNWSLSKQSGAVFSVPHPAMGIRDRHAVAVLKSSHVPARWSLRNAHVQSWSRRKGRSVWQF